MTPEQLDILEDALIAIGLKTERRSGYLAVSAPSGRRAILERDPSAVDKVRCTVFQPDTPDLVGREWRVVGGSVAQWARSIALHLDFPINPTAWRLLSRVEDAMREPVSP